MEIAGVIAMLLALIVYGIIVSSQGDGEIKGVASTIDELPKQIMLMGTTHWQITILRKSGYIHDVREIVGDANKAIANTLTSCRRSGIYRIIITKNDPDILEFYSSNQDGRGKAIGGFRITRLNANSSKTTTYQPEPISNQEIIEAGRKARAELEIAAQKYKPNAASDLGTGQSALNEEPLPVPPRSQGKEQKEGVDKKDRQNLDRDAVSQQLESVTFQFNQAKRDLAAMLLDGIKPTLNEKQREVLATLAEDELIRVMANQITGEEGNSGEPFTFVIPIHFTDSDGTYYENMRLVVSHDAVNDARNPVSVAESDVSDLPKDIPAHGEYDNFGFPEQDAWEGSVYELGGRPQRCDVKLGFRYTDSNGATTNRQIRTKAFVPWLNDDHLVLGFCNYRKANRSFATSQMQDVIDLETGECLDDVDRFLTEAYEASDYKKIDDFIDERMNVVECLLYLARLDGNLTKAQKTIIYDYVKQASGAALVTDAIIQNLIKDFADDLSPQKFRKLLTQMRREQPETFAELCELGERVVGIRRGQAAGGQAALVLIAGVKR